jgi:hypothetical protein
LVVVRIISSSADAISKTASSTQSGPVSLLEQEIGGMLSIAGMGGKKR